ncbi:hypothetical protein F4808DRAFT_437313 [Astrocystis sublimbata]|nr:hypothetical protein F4808DRAFT_437313 [Astrocystis sublimbata]
MTVDTPEKRRYWLLTMPRTASNLLVRILNLDEQNVRPAHHGGYFFFPSMLARMGVYQTPSENWTPEEIDGVRQGTQESLDALLAHFDAAEADGQKVFVKEHISFLNSPYYEMEYMYGKADERLLELPQARGIPESTRSPLNLTCVSDEILKSWYPTILLRHPAMMFPSLFRTAQLDMKVAGRGRSQLEPFEVEATLKFARTMYEFHAERFGKDSQWPVILDADDVISSPELVMKYAKIVGLDPEKIRFSWDKLSEEKISKMDTGEQVMLSSINASTGVDKSKLAGNVDIAAEVAKWKEEFGEEKGSKLERWVRGAMPDYEYLRSKRLTLD